MFDILADRAIYMPIIVLMMMGLYVVVATGNLVKRLVGLSIFQTSVCLLYITVGKVFGGQPPILPPAHHGEDHGEGHAAEAGHAAAAASSHDAPVHDAPAHDAADHAEPAHGEAAHAEPAVADTGHAEEAAHGAASHAQDAVQHVADAAHHADAAPVHVEGAIDGVLYSNPLPHVLILTAIVVGVATLAVGLALVVRIREAYGTIEDTALSAADYSAETGGRE